jgi:hypothetical protein
MRKQASPEWRYVLFIAATGLLAVLLIVGLGC